MYKFVFFLIIRYSEIKEKRKVGIELLGVSMLVYSVPHQLMNMALFELPNDLCCEW